MKKSSQLNKHGGFTLVELVVTIAIASIAMSIAAGILTIMLNSYRQSTNMADVNNLATMTIRKIDQQVRNCKSLNIYNGENDKPAGTEISFDGTKHGLDIGNETYLAGTFNKYACTLDFKKSGSNLLSVTVTIKDKNGNTLSSTGTEIFLVDNNATISGNEGSVIFFS